MKSRALLLFVVLTTAVATSAGEESGIEIRRVEPMDFEILEEWQRITDERDILGVSATRVDDQKWKWRVFVAVAEFVREEPLESELWDRITVSLSTVKGVKSVVHEDREVWIIEGDVNGKVLVSSASSALDSLAPQLRKHMESL
jgi:hypothetical protein